MSTGRITLVGELLLLSPLFAPLFAPLFGGLFFNQFILGMVISFVNYRLFKIYRDKFGKDQFQAVCYWFLPHTPKRLAAFPPSYIREYIG